MFTFNLTFLTSECNPNYRDKDNVTCDTYIKRNWCTKTGGEGPKWNLEFDNYPPIEEYFNEKGETPLVCPQCGCGKGTMYK